MLVLSTIMSLLIRSGCVISATLYLILFIGDRKKEYLYIALFMLSQYLIELMVRGYETGSPIYYYLHSYFSAPVVIKSLLYCASVFLVCCLFRRALDKSRAWILVPVEVLLFIWLVMFPLLGGTYGILVYLLLAAIPTSGCRTSFYRQQILRQGNAEEHVFEVRCILKSGWNSWDSDCL